MVAKVSPDQEVVHSLMAYHDPFYNGTSQPKIHDGAVNDSIGFSTQHVSEIQNETSDTTFGCLLFAGMNTGLVMEKPSGFGNMTARTHLALGFEGSNGIDWAGMSASTGGLVTQRDNYAKWRVVSTGVQFKLLNPVEQDDGWWEAIRLNRAFLASEYLLSTTDDTDAATNSGDHGCLIPSVQSMVGNANIVNDPSYSTGLLRDLKDLQFELHNSNASHEFVRKEETIHLPGEAVTSVVETSGTNWLVNFSNGRDEVVDLVNQFIDPNYDMIYIRFHCRPGGTSRLHTKVVSNQEIVYQNGDRENRFHTKSRNLGQAIIDQHMQARRSLGNAAKVAYR